ncbi:putative membrane-bound dehydrogenase-like protein [Roseimicrobium gellanilyticum]|uniref:Putative membrane-bound dehydrogenase-like protein n=1 Tax=Roseimicrobium gellanilyticum TaxID=748857 RepID=A0A366HUA7_9BACT|nr:PVC-type heme-binding CxxCH protein [Roseimicrobium gellanilyticum]RBP46494.1 putative membrane-bound dehydrogenase-like protein [Roseimicrobium gellanilyticum]
MNRRFHTLLAGLVSGLALHGQAQLQAQAPVSLELKKGDHIAIVGSLLADRQQHSGWLETLIHAENKDKDLVIRNLAVAADEVNTWHRSEDFGTRDQWLLKVGADVVFAFYGFNESFKGYEGIEEFKKNLDAFLKELKTKNYGGEGAPRVVLFSPTAAEKQSNPDIAKPEENNTNLQNYASAMKEVAAANGVQFVDLFDASQKAYAAAKQPLTFNGIHLTVEGDKVLAPVIYKSLFGKDAPSYKGLEKLRGAILDRNEEWHSRYRTVDSYNIHGGRSGLAYKAHTGAFLQNQKTPEPPYVSNYQVMQQEMSVRDVMTENREKRVWAVAKGGDLKVDDSNVPPVTKVETNLPVGGDTFNKTPMTGFKVDAKTGLVEFPSGEEVVGKMKTPKGIKVQLFADEKMFPELIKPVQMAFDTKGRLWVASWRNYPSRTPWSTKGDSLLVLEDTNNDGKADKCTPFMDDLNCPTGFQFYKDGVLVMKSPNLLYARDTDGDGRADKFERILSGLDAADSHHETNSICYEPGGAVYCSDGVFHATQVETPEGPVRNKDGCIYRYEPRTGKFERYAAYGFANPHGRVFDYWGNDIITDATGNNNYYGPGFSGFISEPNKHSKYDIVWQHPSRPCAGTTILSSRHFPDEFRDNFLNCNVISVQGIFRAKFSEVGSGLKGETLYHEYTKPGSTTPEKLNTLVECSPAEVGTFRPSCASVAPDGSLYFADWSNAIIGHMQHHLRDPNRDQIHGRVYRVTFEGRPLLEVKKVDGQPIEKLLDLLKEPENDVRIRAKIELDKHDSKAVVAAVQKWVKQFDPQKVEDAHHILEALWVHQWHNVVNKELINTVLASPEPRARAQAVRVVCYQRDRIPEALEIFKKAAGDESPRVRLEAIRAASFYGGADVPKALEVAYASLKHEGDYYIDYCLKETLKQLQSGAKEKMLPSDPATLDALLSRMDDNELKGMPNNVAAVLHAKLERKSYDLLTRDKAIEELVKLNKSDRATEIVAALKRIDAKSGASAQAASDLGKMLITSPVEALTKAKDQLASLARSANLPEVRRSVWAALIVQDRKPDDVWVASADKSEWRTALVQGIGLVPDPTLRTGFQHLITALLNDGSVKGEQRQAALKALSLMGADNAPANFAVLSKHVIDGNERNAATTAIMQLPRTAWDKDKAEGIAQSVLAYAKSVPAEKRSEQSFVEVNQLGMEMASLAGNTALRKELRGLSVAVFVVKTVHEQLRFDTQRIVVEKGKSFEIIFENDDVMPHNLVVVGNEKHGVIGMAAQTMSPTEVEKARNRQFLPKGQPFVDATHLLNPGQKETLKLKAPDKEGQLEFVCTFPGHWMIMWGKIIVTADVDAYLAANPKFELPMPGAPPAAK